MSSYAPSLKTKAGAELELRRRRAAEAPAEAFWSPMADPLPGVPHPQRMALESTASVIGYGGAAGGGKTDLALGMAGTRHFKSIIFRRVFPSVRGIIERSRELFARDVSQHSKDSYNELLHLWRLADGRLIEFGSLQYDADKKKHQGQPRDFFAFDEATEFPESVVRFVTAWNRSVRPDVQPQVLLTFNPPTDDDGEWIIKFFGPWLDPEYAGTKAVSGEPRYFAMVDGKETEVAVDHPGARLRTFIAASLKDNPYLLATGYGDTIDALPEPLRSILRGEFGTAQQANPWQIISRAHVKAAQARWTETAPGPLNCIGVDVARGGADNTVLAARHGTWFARPQLYPGKATPDGPSVAALIVGQHRDRAAVNIDVIGVGSSVYDHAKGLGLPAVAVNVGAGSDQTDRSGKLHFGNIRAELWWKFREALDPLLGSGLALPDDPDLVTELCAPRFFVRAGRLWVESKDDVRERIGRSTDRADAVLLAWTDQTTQGVFL